MDIGLLSISVQTRLIRALMFLVVNVCFLTAMIVISKGEWAETEYIEKPVISKKDKAFLEYVKEEYKCIARDKNGELFLYRLTPYKEEGLLNWIGRNCSCLHLKYNVDFPMVKWEDSEPWLIEDLKKLEVVDSYE
jgi:hypothetical protein